MNSAPNHHIIDTYVKEVLSRTEIKYTPFDWSEIEVLLNHETNKPPIKINKKTAFIFGGIVIVGLVLFGVVQIISKMDLSSPKAEQKDELMEEPFSFVSADSVAETSLADSKIDSTRTDTIKVVSNPLKTDSIPLVKLTESNKPTIIKENSVKKIKPPLDKKKKTDSLKSISTQDSSPIINNKMQISVDPSLSTAPQEIIENPSIIITPSNNVVPKQDKSKPQKNKKNIVSTSSTKKDSTSIPDSLKIK